MMFATFVVACWAAGRSRADPQLDFFERHIRPLLLDHCIGCHGSGDPQGQLALDSRQGWQAAGVIVPGDPEQSRLIAAVRYLDSDLQMPPPDHGGPLPAAAVNDLEQWIRLGAPDPRTDPDRNVSSEPQRRPAEFSITQQDLTYWAFAPLPSHLPQWNVDDPQTASSSQTAPYSLVHPVDQLIDTELRRVGLHRNKPASPRELVRRLYFGLWGLPPEPEVVAQFERDSSLEAWRRLIDQLLDSPYYGQRWGRYWLDWVRYAETNGYERDGSKPDVWRYRDYVIDSLNRDKPFDRFLHEQLAGDLLIESERLNPETHTQPWQDAVVATGFYRLHVWDDEPDDTQAAELDDLDDVLITIGSSMLGLTIGCARCHDHKFDPLSQADYYGLLDLLRDIDPYGLPKKGGGGRGTGRIQRYLVSDDRLVAWQQARAAKVELLQQQLAAPNVQNSDELKQQLEQLAATQPPFAQALTILPPPGDRKPTHILTRGDYRTPGRLVQADVPQVLRLATASAVHSLSNELGSKQPAEALDATAPVKDSPIRSRLDLARWMTGPADRITARVLANRVWQNHFGRGIVATSDDFGNAGQPPSNSALLDWLASQLIQSGWSLKALHRTILTSAAYRMSSRTQEQLDTDNRAGRDTNAQTTGQAAKDSDPDNRLFWRQNLRRLDAEAIRDSMLYYAGSLGDKQSGPSVYTTLSPEVQATANPVSVSHWIASPEGEQNCRSVFLAVKRSLKDPLLESFDFANSHAPVAQRPVTTVAPQALMLLNEQFVHRMAQQLADRVRPVGSTRQQKLQQLWQIVYQRMPSTAEHQAADNYLDSHAQAAEAWPSLCRVLLNSNECIYVD
ncbi:MAG: PSD1 domain-containing protein [Pirellulaceae bacterium]|nr:PSD1 domain-containing protein [Pirellulaceae bacterium]